MAKLYSCFLMSIQMVAVLSLNPVLREMRLQNNSQIQLLVVKLAVNKTSGNDFKLE